MSKQIVIAQQGWVFIGDTYHTATEEILIENAAVIRRWGTTDGLGQLAIHGPTAETILDACPTVRIPLLSVIATMDCLA